MEEEGTDEDYHRETGNNNTDTMKEEEEEEEEHGRDDTGMDNMEDTLQTQKKPVLMAQTGFVLDKSLSEHERVVVGFAKAQVPFQSKIAFVLQKRIPLVAVCWAQEHYHLKCPYPFHLAALSLG